MAGNKYHTHSIARALMALVVAAGFMPSAALAVGRADDGCNVSERNFFFDRVLRKFREDVRKP